MFCSSPWLVRIAFLLSLPANGQPLEFYAPRSIPAGMEVLLRTRVQGKPAKGAEIRIRGPATAAARIGSDGLRVRKGPGLSFSLLTQLFPGERVFLLPETSGKWCSVITPFYGLGWAPCASVRAEPFPQPLGVTNEAGELRIREATIAVAEVVLEANWRGQTASQKILVTPIESEHAEEVAPAIRFRQRAFFKDGEGPFRLQILEIVPTHPAVRILPVRAKDRAAGRETVRSMARRYGAVAAVNAGYFVLTGPFAGASTGVYQTGGEVITSGSGRSGAALCGENGTIAETRIGVFDFFGKLSIRNESFPIMGLNRPRLEQDLVLYTPALGPSTQSPAGGFELVLNSEQRVAEILDGPGNAAIPLGGSVVSGSGIVADWLRRRGKKGEKLEIEVGLSSGAELLKNCSPTDIIGAGPQIVRDGRVFVRTENIGHEAARHPRTAFAVTQSGRFLFVTVDGRQPASVGMRLDEFAAELVRLGAVDALNLDGGGSTTMVVNGQVRNSPSDRTERPVGDAILLYSIPSADAFLQLFDRLAEDPAQIPAAVKEPLRNAILAGSESVFRRVMDKQGGQLGAQARRLLSQAAAVLR